MSFRLIFAGILTGLFASGAAAQGQPRFVIDGEFDDWNLVAVAATDPAGDNSKAFDLTQVKVYTRDTVVFIQWDTNSNKNLQAGSNADGTIRIELGFQSGDSLTVDTRSRIAYENGNSNSVVSWYSIDYATLPTAALPLYETRIDVSNYASFGEYVTVDFSGSDSLDSGPISVQMNNSAQQPPTPQPGDLDRDDCTDFRIVNINTLQSGMTDNSQKNQLGRILSAFDPEIICLQEEYDNSAATLKTVIEGIDPNENGQPWNVHKEWDNVIATQHTLIPYVNGDRYATAVVDMGDGDGGGAVFVVSIHNKCCGYAGDSSDTKRIVSMNILVGIIANLRSGSLNAAMAPYANAPVVIVGDWNHVGSDTPLQVVIDPAVPGMKNWIPVGAATDTAVTWRDFDGFGFMPGLLDLLVYDTLGLSQRKGFVLDTYALSGPTLSHYGLQLNDSWASDHLAMVTDFEFGVAGPNDCLLPCPADLNNDGFIDSGDISAFIAMFLAGNPAVDFNNDGFIDSGDISAFIALYLAGC